MEVQVNSPSEMTDLFEWANMNCATRCFGHAQVPNGIAMCPLIDLVNHADEQTILKFYATPASLNLQLLDIEID